MMYWHFLALFIAGPLLLLAVTLPRPVDARRPWWRALGLIALFALVYTTPWDNYLIYDQVWSYGADRVLATIGYVPVEEYLFFILQPLLTGCWLYHLLIRRDRSVPAYHRSTAKAKAGAGLFVLLGGLGFWLMVQPGGRYLGLILAWTAPILAGEWFYGGALFWRLRRLTLVAILIPTFYLWAADALAIHQGIWSLSASATLGWTLLGLPIEEAIFFLFTNVMVVQGLLLLLYPPAEPLYLPTSHEAARRTGSQ